jgi:GNAT superfamily N-acetyltransferase
MSVLFGGVIGAAVLVTGRTVTIEVADPDDLERVRAFYAALSDASTYSRFFTVRRRVPESELRAVVGDADSHRVTLLASDGAEVLGIGELIVTGDEAAEVAFAVADAHHHEGVATLLLERLAMVGSRLGLKRLVAQTLPSNHDMRLVFRTVGLPVRTHFDGDVVDVELDLSDLAPLRAQIRERRHHALCT